MLVLIQRTIKGVRQCDGTMLAAGTADADDEIILALLDVMRDEEFHHIHQFLQENLTFLEIHHIAADRLIVTRHFLQLLNIEGVG